MQAMLSNEATIEKPVGSSARQWLILLVLSLGLAIVIIDGTIVNVALPSIRKDFNPTLRGREHRGGQPCIGR